MVLLFEVSLDTCDNFEKEFDRLSAGFFGATAVDCSKDKLESLDARPTLDISENDEDRFNLDGLLTFLLDCTFFGGLYLPRTVVISSRTCISSFPSLFSPLPGPPPSAQ